MYLAGLRASPPLNDSRIETEFLSPLVKSMSAAQPKLDDGCAVD